MRHLLVILTLMIATTAPVHAIESNDSVTSVVNDTTIAKKGLLKKVLSYLAPDLNMSDKESSVGLTIIGGPHFDTMTKLGVGIVANYGYRLKGCEAPLMPSNLLIKGDVSTAKFWSVEVQNNMILSDDSKRINSLLKIEHMPLYFWGIGFPNGRLDENKTLMKQLRVEFNTNILFKLSQGLFVGPFIHWEYNKGDSIDIPELLNGQSLHQHNYGVGITVDFDTRDFITGPTKGIYFHVNQVFFPRFLWNGNYGFTRTDFCFSIYQKAWRGAIIAANLHGLFNYGTPSWATMALLGDNNNMRGYYHGRYRDKHMITAVVELRQKLWRWLGMAAWIGGGTVFHDINSMHLLPNFGLGLRWAIRKHVNIRLDYGFGRNGESAFIFGINEAF